MTIALRYAARSDVGLLREGNEDSAYAGPRLLAVADGMGGHAHGEVASSVAIAAIAQLDEGTSDGDLLAAIEAAVRAANRRLHEMVARDPSLKGMGTTLTAMLWSGTRIALVHVGDSRAYLLRAGELYQITHDHTLVQSLVDEGRITPEDAATHPQRSILLRALDGSGEVEPDLSLREAQLGDRYLLCSDGLSGVVSAETLHHTLTTLDDPEAAVRQLIDLANRGGGPDNITCIVADVIDLGPGSARLDSALVVGAAGASRPGREIPDTPAGRAMALGDVDEPVSAAASLDEPEPAARRRRLWPAIVALLTLLLVLVGVGGYFGYQYTQDKFFVGADGDKIAVFRGIHNEVAGFKLYSVVKSSQCSVSGLNAVDKDMVTKAAITRDTLAEAEAEFTRLTGDCGRTATTPPVTPGATTGPTTGPTTGGTKTTTSPGPNA